MSTQQKKDAHEVTLDEALNLAQGHHQAGNLIIADRTYRDILKAVPDHYPTVHYLSLLLYQRGNVKEALDFSKKSVTTAPEDIGCWINHGVILAANDRKEEAVAAFDEALSIDPESPEALANKAYTLWELKRYEDAEDAAAQAVAINPDNGAAYINLGIAVAAQGRLSEAEKIWEQAATLDQDASLIYSNWSNTLRSMGRLDEAKQKARVAVEKDEKNHEACNNLANAYRDLGELDKAEDYYRKAVALQPDYCLAHNNLSTALIDQGRFAEAVTAARYAISFKEDYADAYGNMSIAYHKMGQFDEAYAAADKAVQLAPDEPLHYLNLVDVLIAIERNDEAEIVMKQALGLEPDAPRTLVKLAEVYRSLNRVEEALAALDKAIEQCPEMVLILVEKARILQLDNRVEEALETIEKVLKTTPNHLYALLAKVDCLLTTNQKEKAKEILETLRPFGAETVGFYHALTSFKKFTADDPDLKKMEELAARSQTFGLEAEASIHFALFKAYEDIKDYDRAFDHLARGNEAGGRNKPYNAERERQSLQRKKETFTPALFADYEGKGYESDLPVFILGMPRSGTTLTEQIVSSHPHVFGAGELLEMNSTIKQNGPMTPDNAAAMGKAYVDRLKTRDTTGKALRITDKMPGNCYNIGLIRCILPQAKIILCSRDPVDNCLSCYKQNFATGHNWAYSQEDLIGHYRNYADLMAYWRDVLGDQFLEVRYEDTVNDFEEQARKLIAYIGLPWDDACLAPHKQKRAVLTASKNQVIKPIYTTSVAAWKRYEKQLTPLADGLASLSRDAC